MSISCIKMKENCMEWTESINKKMEYPLYSLCSYNPTTELLLVTYTIATYGKREHGDTCP
jgi:hypothetical protein